MKEKGKVLKVECLKEHRVITIFGDVRIRRRLYRDSNGENRFLLDEKMGLDKGCHVSPKIKEIMRLRGYLIANCYGLRDYRLEVTGDGLRGLGAIEGNVDKVVANRMKKRGISWTIKGAQRMTRLIQMGQLHSQITCIDKSTDSQLPEIKINRRKTSLEKDTGAWLEAGLLAL